MKDNFSERMTATLIANGVLNNFQINGSRLSREDEDWNRQLEDIDYFKKDGKWVKEKII